jgi:hypothetical protein
VRGRPLMRDVRSGVRSAAQRLAVAEYEAARLGEKGAVLRRQCPEVGWVGSWRGDADAFRFQPPPVEPCMRFSRTRLTDAFHRRCSTGARQARLGLGAATIPLRETSPNVSRDR